MNRLTYEKLCDILQHVNRVTFILDGIGEESYSSQEVYEAIKELQRYRDLEEQGRLIELPCAVGDTVWQITRNFISEFKIKSFVCDNEGFFFYWECVSGIYINLLGFSSNRIGKDIFLTKEEAEAKLKELEE